MTVARQGRRRRQIDSYEHACELLKAQPLQPRQPLRHRGGDFADMTLNEFRQLSALSLPPPVRLIAFPLGSTSQRPNTVAEFAAELLLQQEGRTLRPAEPRERPHFGERANQRWILWGDLIVAPGGHLALGPLSIGPYPGAEQQLEPGAAPYRGISAEVLRAIPIEHLIHEVVARLQEQAGWDERLHEYGWQTPADQRELLAETLKRLTSRTHSTPSRYPDDHYHDVAILYLELLRQGQGQKILVTLAALLGISRQTARNWVHRARQLGYLAQGTRGRAGATPGPKLHTQ